MDSQKYLEYLDKEMTIMGILSAVCVAAPAGILNLVLQNNSYAKSLLWDPCKFFIVLGSVLCVLSAMLFYKERSLLAWYYGQICLTEAMTNEQTAPSKLREWLRDADSWETWLPYSWGFTSLVGGFAEYILALFFVLVPSHWLWLLIHLHKVKVATLFVCPVVAAIFAAIQLYAMTHYKFSDNYWAELWHSILRRFTNKKPLPHEGVYTRLRPSSIHGVGVFAIADIPKAIYPFEPDNDSLVSVCSSETEYLPAEVKRLYKDFCVYKNGKYLCPSSLNKLTPAWFLNHSKTPNVAADSSLKFYTTREIRAGEELTTDYEDYSENGLVAQDG